MIPTAVVRRATSKHVLSGPMQGSHSWRLDTPFKDVRPSFQCMVIWHWPMAVRSGHPHSTQHIDSLLLIVSIVDPHRGRAPHAVLAGRGPRWRNDDALARALQYHAQDAEVGANAGGRFQSRPPRAAVGAR